MKQSNRLNLFQIIVLCSVAMVFLKCSGTSINSGNRDKVKPDLIRDSLAYDLINYVIGNNLPEIKVEFDTSNYLLDRQWSKTIMREDSIRLITLDTLFNKNDLDLMFKQNELSTAFSINPTRLKSKINIIPLDTILRFSKDKDPSDFWNKFRQKYGRHGFVTIGLPIFSLDNNTVILFFSISSGRLSGEGGTFILKKVRNKWITVYTLDYAIS
jgi:hypothetical protein